MNSTDERYNRIADLSEQIGKLNQIIDLHRQTTADESMIQQYVLRRDEFLERLQKEFRAINLTVSLKKVA